ncbi:MHS family MFS transporter [Francisella sp. Scap27]|uniref:MFS transporter n=1 Tax=Francisella sp. Scap27 TaxID=2589986 RepID=UPI0015BFDEEF|nr:MFS transporter [Francisella sp. Scap27]QLE79756.1 MHS family MFS transporter [Francisella sp. Scap27]
MSFSKKHIFCASASTVVEWYDFMLFAYLTTIFAHNFFPSASPSSAILMTFGVFAAGFFMGPVGSLVIGSVGDRFGRKVALVLSISLMIIPMIVIAILPTYNSIGILAPIILVLMRLVQGFSIGGSYGGVMVLMIESAKPNRRGFVASFATMASGTGVFIASLIVMLLTYKLGNQALESWGWRLGYFIGLVLAVLALIMRLSIPESSSFENLEEQGELSSKPVRSMLKKQFRPLFFAISISAYGNIAYYLVLSYLETHFIQIGYDEFTSLAIITIFSLLFSFSAPFWGWLSDLCGRKALIKVAIALYILVSYPAFMIMGSSLAMLVLAVILLSLPLMLIWGSYGAAAPELFRAKYRYSGNALSYNIGNSFFGGTIPFVATLLFVSLGFNAPAWLLIVSSVIMVPIIYCMPETRQKSV